MKLGISISEVVSIFKEIKEQPEQLYEIIRSDIRETIGQYLSELMDAELMHFLADTVEKKKLYRIGKRLIL